MTPTSVLTDPLLYALEIDDVMDERSLSANESVSNDSNGSPRDAARVAGVKTTSVDQLTTKRSERPRTRRPIKHKLGPVPYTTELQRRKRSELLTLRQEAEALNRRLALLQQLRHDRLALAVNATDGGGSAWQGLAAIECEERKRAERTNRELKVILETQQKTVAAICKVLGKRRVFEGRDFVFQLKPTIPRFPSRLDYSNAILADLERGLDLLRVDTETIFTPPEDNKYAIVSRSQDIRRTPDGHRVAETTTITPLPCSVQDAGETLWRFVSSDVDKSFYSIRKCNPHSFEMNCVANSREGPQHIDGVVIYRRYDESDRIVIVGTSTWFLATGGLQFEDKFWTVISPSPSDPLHSSVVQTRYQLQANIPDAKSVLAANFAQAEDAVLSSIGRKLRNAMLALQSALLTEVDWTR
ncbi:uncharacterized protein IUM83_00389 [Phytophthora cinnamomi]|uniref:uncharacterized protein n=1 Tax=Phytophthora cinnamomi TaxID=4785 RepID=UPI00355A36E3|nr:hypothetical protein IUM83_00389 [Phytophthora cinnamomi]